MTALQPPQDATGALARRASRRWPGALLWLWRGWASRSLAIGALATPLDLLVGTLALGAGASTRVAALTGLALGGTFGFFANRFFAFPEKGQKLATPALRYVIVTVLSSLLHAELTAVLRDDLQVPFVGAKLVADVLVFSVLQLAVLRYIVFPATPEPRAVPPPPGLTSPPD
jgi:putative flippase GtrA